ncbi:unnamed protein product [Polarella glacialis]|uniref:ATP-dependent transporter ycf16 n=1 Tax=Polarella glacialis TaxID=89957 RepID=A0A813GTQ8_POLGL|nr:unnamed protein product [Polarella glacialis]
MSRQLRLDLRLKLFERLLSQDVAFFDATRAGAMAQRVEGDVEDMSRPVPLLINNVLQSVVLIVGALICCLISSARLTVLSAACVGPMIYLTKVSAEWGASLNNAMTACEEEANSVVTEAMTNIRHVRGFSAERHEAGKYSRVLSRLFRKMRKEAYGDLIVENLEGSLEFLVQILVLCFGGMLILQDHEEAGSVGGLIAFTMYWGILRDGVDSIQSMFSELAQAAGAAQRVFDLLDISPDIPLDEGVELQRESFLGRVVFEDVHFTYQSRPEKPVLRGLSLEVPAGSTCALVGRSGAGKSTLMHLLLRFYDPQQGQILIDGVPLTALSLRSLHDLTGFVSQDTKLSYGSVRENLTYGLPWVRPEEGELEAAGREANCSEFVEEMEEGYDAKVGEGGVRLSGGQRQRLAIARAFLRRPRLLVLDEATSHLDSENEQLVQAAIDRLIHAARCTVILIAHRLSTVRNADVIAVVHDGCVAEKGSHDELMQLEDGIYAKLIAKQAERAANVLPEDGGGGGGGGDAGRAADPNVDGLFDKVLGRRDSSESGSSSSKGSGGSSGSSKGSGGSSSSLSLLDSL